jgi:hypothetical protein
MGKLQPTRWVYFVRPESVESPIARFAIDCRRVRGKWVGHISELVVARTGARIENDLVWLAQTNGAETPEGALEDALRYLDERRTEMHPDLVMSQARDNWPEGVMEAICAGRGSSRSREG